MASTALPCPPGYATDTAFTRGFYIDDSLFESTCQPCLDQWAVSCDQYTGVTTFWYEWPVPFDANLRLTPLFAAPGRAASPARWPACAPPSLCRSQARRAVASFRLSPLFSSCSHRSPSTYPSALGLCAVSPRVLARGGNAHVCERPSFLLLIGLRGNGVERGHFSSLAHLGGRPTSASPSRGFSRPGSNACGGRRKPLAGDTNERSRGGRDGACEAESQVGGPEAGHECSKSAAGRASHSGIGRNGAMSEAGREWGEGAL